MTADRIQIQYDSARQIATSFEDHEIQFRHSLDRLDICVGRLRRGGWEGEAASQFYRDWDATVQPSMRRLCAAFATAAETMRAISDVLGKAEDEAAAWFRTGEDDASTRPPERSGLAESRPRDTAAQVHDPRPATPVAGSQVGNSAATNPERDE